MIDVDVFISPDAPSIFDAFPVGFHAAEDRVIKYEDEKKFCAWLKTWGNLENKVHFNGGVMLMDRLSLQALRPWLDLPRIQGPFYTADQHHENAAVYCTWPDFKPISSTWNEPIPGKPGPVNRVDLANFHHAYGIETAHGKELVLGQVKRQYQGSFLNRMDELGSLLCVFRLIDQMGYHAGVVSDDLVYNNDFDPSILAGGNYDIYGEWNTGATSDADQPTSNVPYFAPYFSPLSGAYRRSTIIADIEIVNSSTFQIQAWFLNMDLARIDITDSKLVNLSSSPMLFP